MNNIESLKKGLVDIKDERAFEIYNYLSNVAANNEIEEEKEVEEEIIA